MAGFLIILAAAALSSWQAAIAQDEVVLTNDKVIQGKVMKHDSTEVAIEVTVGTAKVLQTFPASQVKKVNIQKPEAIARAQASYDSRDYRNAASAFEAAAGKFAAYDWGEFSLYMAADSYVKLKDWENANRVSRKLLDSYPETQYRQKASLMLADALREAGEPGRALEFYRALQKETDSNLLAMAEFGIGDCLMQQKKYEEALEEGFLRVSALRFHAGDIVARSYGKARECFLALGNNEMAGILEKELENHSRKEK